MNTGIIANTWSPDDTHIKKRVGCWFANIIKEILLKGASP